MPHLEKCKAHFYKKVTGFDISRNTAMHGMTARFWQRGIYEETKDKVMHKTNKIFLFYKKGIVVHLFFDYYH